jgi:hypothetical protein
MAYKIRVIAFYISNKNGNQMEVSVCSRYYLMTSVLRKLSTIWNEIDQALRLQVKYYNTGGRAPSFSVMERSNGGGNGYTNESFG